MEGTKTPFRVIENRREAINQTLDELRSGDVLILAGKGHETYQILGREKIHFDEREVIADYLKRQRAEGRRLVVEDLD
jgi:UDP-N-acetylmuramoyl-L-alanyl-D-glutamate--2,6-diaminopimelate ligase